MAPANFIGNSEEDIVFRASLDKIFSSEFTMSEGETGKYIWTVQNVTEDGFEFNNGKRIKIRLTYNQTKNEVCGITLKKFNLNDHSKVECISVSNINLAQIQAFLSNIDQIDLKSYASGKLVLDRTNIKDKEILHQVETLLNEPQKLELVKSLINNSEITNQDLVNTGYRKKSLKIFENLLNDPGYVEQYKLENQIKQDGYEAAWQYFFENNAWIFGYGLNYIYCGNIDNSKLEQVVSGSDFNNGGKRVDALMATMSDIQQFVLVELKLPGDELVGNKPRTECWSVSAKVTDGIAQIQKTVMKFRKCVFEKEAIKDSEGINTGQIIYNYTPKSYLIIGRLQEFVSENGVNQDKYSSFQLYRSSLLNPEIITYDELYNRAKFIVGNV